MKRRYYTSKNYRAFLGDGDADWAVYDRQTKDPDERPLAVFARRADAVQERCWMTTDQARKIG